MTLTPIRQRSDNSRPTANDKIRELTCRSCFVRLKDIKLMKMHYWKVHINEQEQEYAQTVLTTNRPFVVSPSKINSSMDSTDSSDVLSSRTKPKSVKRLNKAVCIATASAHQRNKSLSDISNKQTSNKKANREDSQDDTLLDQDENFNADPNILTVEEMKYFSLQSLLDETKIVKRVEALYEGMPYDKSRKNLFLLLFLQVVP